MSELNGENAAPAQEPPRRRRSWWRRLFLSLVIIVVGIVILEHYLRKSKPAQASATPAIPVVAATARIGDLPVYLNGLGSVTPVYTVTLRTRVDGELFSVPVREGQMVAAGDLIAQIDPRPFEVQLLQAQGQMERDEAA